MLTSHAPASHESERRLSSELEQIGRSLARIDNDVRRIRRLLIRQEDPVSLYRLVDSQKRALRHANRARQLLTQGDHGVALSHVLHLLEEVREGIAGSRTTEDVGAMAAEANDEPTIKALSTLDRRISKIVMHAGQLFELATDAYQDLSQGAAAMPDNDTVKAIRELNELLASRLDVNVLATPARSTNARYQAVSDQMAASLDALGMPHDGVQLPPDQDEAEMRSRLIDGLNRNFTARDQDGFRTYFRSAPQPVMRDAQSDARLLRGASLVNANLLRTEADGVLAILDRLPDMLRFTPAWSRESPEIRARVREALDQLVETARDPMGINSARGRFQCTRLQAAVADMLELGEIVTPAIATKLSCANENSRDFRQVLMDEDGLEALRSRSSVVRDQEVYGEIVSLAELMAGIRRRVTQPQSGSTRIMAVGRLEELLSAACDSATALEDDLVRMGTSAAEQTILFFGDTNSDEQQLSLAQYIGWTRALCEPFARVDNRTASLTATELDLLHAELTSLTSYSNTLSSATSGLYDGGLLGTRRQLMELKTFLEQASSQVGGLLANDSNLPVTDKKH